MSTIRANVLGLGTVKVGCGYMIALEVYNIPRV